MALLHGALFFYISEFILGRERKMRMSELLFIGTGGSVATEERDNTSFLLLKRDTVVMIDCPGSVVQKLKKAGVEPKNVQSLIVTHVHPDHVYGLPSLIHSLMLDDCVIKIFGSDVTVNFCAQLLDLFDLRSEKVKCRVNFTPVVEGKNYRFSSSLTGSFFKVPHSPSSMAVAFHLIEEKMELLYSGDTPRYPELLKRIENIDFLIHDCSAPSRFFAKYPALNSMHTDSLALGEMAREAGVKHLVPCHFFGELDFALEEIEAEIRENFRGDLTIPVDFSRIRISKKA